MTLGTLADLMPLVDENRILVRSGLALLRASERSGLRQVFKRKDLLGKRSARRTSPGRCRRSSTRRGAWESRAPPRACSLRRRAEEAEAIVEQLFALDGQRKSMGENAWNLMLEQAKESLEKTGGRCVLVHDERIQRGITGIMASRLQGFFKAPAIVIAEAGDMAVGLHPLQPRQGDRGFLRPPRRGFPHLRRARFRRRVQHRARHGCGAFLESFFSQRRGDRPRRRRERRPSTIDAEIPLTFLSPDLQKTVDLFEPYGEGNPPLVFLTAACASRTAS